MFDIFHNFEGEAVVTNPAFLFSLIFSYFHDLIEWKDEKYPLYLSDFFLTMFKI